MWELTVPTHSYFINRLMRQGHISSVLSKNCCIYLRKLCLHGPDSGISRRWHGNDILMTLVEAWHGKCLSRQPSLVELGCTSAPALPSFGFSNPTRQLGYLKAHRASFTTVSLQDASENFRRPRSLLPDCSGSVVWGLERLGPAVL